MPLVLLLLAALLLPAEAQAYVGPGLGLGALGAIAGVFFSILLAIMAMFWYPIKRTFGLAKKKPAANEYDPLE